MKNLQLLFRFSSVVLLGVIPMNNLAQSSSLNNEIALVGLFVNDQEITNIDVLQNKNGYYLPFELFIQKMGLKPVSETATDWAFHSPLGDAQIAKNQIVVYQNQPYLPLNAFKSLGIHALYHQSSLAIKLYIPWDSENPFGKKAQNTPKRDRKIDFYPDIFGLGGIKLNGDLYNGEQNKESQALNMGLNGYLLGGLWGLELGVYQNGKFSSKNDRLKVNNLYWLKSRDHWAMRLGNNRHSYGLGQGDYSGLTFAYSNKNITKHLAYTSSYSQHLLARNGYSSARNIEGTGPAGGIAELRVDGRPIARVRIALDKKYEFVGLNLDNYSDHNYNVEVAIFEYSLSEPPIRIDKPFLSRRRSQVATDEVLIEAGAGKRGNIFKKRDNVSKNDFTSHLYAEYGLHNNVAIRGSVTKSSFENRDNPPYETMVGMNIGLPFEINLDLSYKNLISQKIYNSQLDYSNKYLSLNYHYQQIMNKNFLKKEGKRQYLNVNFYPIDRINLSFHGTHYKDGSEKAEQYFSAYLSTRLTDNVNFNINRDRYNDYYYHLNWHLPDYNSNLNAEWTNKHQKIRISKDVLSNLSLGSSVTHWNNNSHNAYNVYADYRYNEQHKLHAAFDYFNHQNGYDLSWQYQLDNDANVQLGFHKNQVKQSINNESSENYFDQSHYFYLQFSFNLFNSKQGVQLGQYHPSHYGNIVVNLESENNEPLTLDDEIQLQLDQYPVQAYKISDNQYMLENIKTGKYKLSFPMGNLPLEYQNKNLPEPIVKVEKATPTFVDYTLTKTFGILGQLRTEKENVKIEFYQNDKKVAETYTVQYGYYQVIGLPKGDYMIKTAGQPSKKVTIKDEILFDVGL
ncbi:Uncharacterised protein [Phocoenobacter uteri]|uniref:Uncharacterized protein n=1 Tax=Phocoenobacter uteri TaxID=146806 RepID=A0A379C8F1_9PAST|nr:hypothetical protein [Phocoenobacter uteri]MDG6882501.1 hypothetical protein [Phocoenobacter uteri]SUB58662.1 Uncharacterised protein [Phocoenobacter uteri]